MPSNLKSVIQRLARFPAGSTVFRSLFSKPSYVVISVIVLGVSIAAQMDIMAIVDATLLRPPSGRTPQEFGFIRSSLPKGIVSYPDYLDIRQRNTFFSGTFAYSSWKKIGLSHGDDSGLVACSIVSGSFFPTLGVEPALGRVLTDRDDVNGAEPVALVSESLADRWRLTVGSIVKINTAPYTVVGVLPGDFHGIDRDLKPEIWVACAQGPTLDRHALGMLRDRNLQWVRVAGRLKPGSSAANANAELATIAQQLSKEYPTTNLGMELKLDSFSRFQFSENESSRTMLLISGIVWFLFALAFANFFSLTLLRIFSRRRELAIKLALGATRGDIGAWLLGELGAVLALSLAAGYALSRAFLFVLRLDPTIGKLIETAGVQVDWQPFLTVAVSSLACSFIVWLLAMRAACRVDLQSAIKETSSAPRRHVVVGALYAVQFAIALFLLSMASSFVDALHAVAVRKLPFRSENLLLVDVNLRSIGMSGQRSAAYVDNLLDAVGRVPGVVSAAASSTPLLTPAGWTNLIVDGRDPSLDPDKGLCSKFEVTSDFWKTAGISLLGGRFFTEADIAAKVNVGVINAAAARRFWPGQDPLGRTFKPFPESPLVTVIGVTVDVPESRSSQIRPLFYRPSKRVTEDAMTLHIAVKQDTAGMRENIRRQLLTVWPDKNLPPLRPIQDQIDLASADLVTAVRLVLWVAGFATLVTGCGLYFFSAYTASQYIKDAAIRMALGAGPGDIILAHLARYRLAVLAGLAIGGLLLASAQPVFGQFDIEIGSPKFVLVAIAALPLVAIAIVGLCVPLRKIGSLNVYHTLTLSE